MKSFNLSIIFSFFVCVCPLWAKEINVIVINDSSKHDVVVRVQRRRFAGYDEFGAKTYEYTKEEQEIEFGGVWFFKNIYYKGVSFWKKRMAGIHNITPSMFHVNLRDLSDIDLGDLNKLKRGTVVLRISSEYEKNYKKMAFIPQGHTGKKLLDAFCKDLSKISQIKGKIAYNGYKVLGAQNSQVSISGNNGDLKYFDKLAEKHKIFLGSTLTFCSLKNTLSKIICEINAQVAEDNSKNFINGESIKKNFLHLVVINDYNNYDIMVRTRKFDLSKSCAGSKDVILKPVGPVKDKAIEAGELCVIKDIDINGVSFWKKRTCGIEKVLFGVKVDFEIPKEGSGVIFLRVGDEHKNGHAVVRFLPKNHVADSLPEEIIWALSIVSCIKGKLNFKGYEILGEKGSQDAITDDLNFLWLFNKKLSVLKNNVKFTRLRNDLKRKRTEIQKKYDQWLDQKKKRERKLRIQQMTSKKN